MNILLVSEYYPPLVKGGGEINLALLAQELVRQGMKVIVLTSRVVGLPSYEQIDEVEIYRRLKTGKKVNSFFGNLARSILFPKSAVKEIKKLKKEKSIDVIHFIGNSIIVASKIKKLGSPLFATIESYPTVCPKGDRMYYGKEECKIVCSFSQFVRCQQKSSEIGKMKNRWYLQYNPFFLLYNYRFYKKLSHALGYCKLIAISNYVKELLTLHSHNSEVIPNVIDTSWFKEQSSDLSLANKKTLILYLGSLTKYKGPHILLEAIRGLDCRCEFYGEGIMKEELSDFIKKYNLDAEIFPPLPYEKVPSLYARADIVVFPSLWPEPFGRIAIEAMAAGKPVIGSKVGAIPELITEETGMLVSPGNSPELRQAIEKLVKDKFLTKSRDPNKPTKPEYNKSIIAGQVIKIYQEAL